MDSLHSETALRSAHGVRKNTRETCTRTTVIHPIGGDSCTIGFGPNRSLAHCARRKVGSRRRPRCWGARGIPCSGTWASTPSYAKPRKMKLYAPWTVPNTVCFRMQRVAIPGRGAFCCSRGRERGYVIRREGVTANGQPLSSAHGNAVIVIGGDKQQYLDGLRRLRDATDAARSASINARSVPLPGDGHRHNGDLPG